MKKMWIVLAVVCLLASSVMAVSAADVRYGDVNGDGRVNNRDLGLLLQYAADWDVEMDMEMADVNHDGRVNNRDVGMLQQYLADWDVSLDPVEPDVPGDDNVFNDTELDWT